MTTHRQIKSTHAILRRYYETLDNLRAQGATNEMNLRHAFQVLLADTGKAQGWTLIPEYSEKHGDHRIQVDGVIKDRNGFIRGWWEAKDTDDNLDAEIQKKFDKGYPKDNIIFEDTETAVLFQDGRELGRINIADRNELANLLNIFFSYSEPNIEGWEKASVEFKDEVPKLARRLNEIIKEAHQNNRRFEKAYNDLLNLCRSSLNPNISRDAVDEMLIQHLLTERIIRRIFEWSDFRSRNVIAVEIEKTVTALASKSFDRDEFLSRLDRFYLAIENAAQTIRDFTEKQRFLNTIYERFFQGYSVRVADTHGIVYTPQPVVEFMCNSVQTVLREEFGRELWDRDVIIIDPAVGTGSFIVNLIREGRVPTRELKRFYTEQLFANEVMLLPYYIASLSIEHTYYERMKEYEPFEGLCFVDTLDLETEVPVENNRKLKLIFGEENTKRIKKQQEAKITIVLGNPPYNAHQVNENDNNRNRKYPDLEGSLRRTYVKSSKATNKNALWDAYVKFFRWATDRLEDRDGIVCFISNNSFVDGYAFDGMRKHLLQDFTRLYHFDLRGNARKGQREGSVFDIMVSVGITIAVKSKRHRKSLLFYHTLPPGLSRNEKLDTLTKNKVYKKIKWRSLHPDKRYSWILPAGTELFEKAIRIGRFEARKKKCTDTRVIFQTFGNGVKTNRDPIVYDFTRDKLAKRVEQFLEDYNSDVDKFKRALKAKKIDPEDKLAVDEFVNREKIQWSESLKLNLVRGVYGEFKESLIRNSLYRPFTKNLLYFDSLLNERRYQFPRIFPTLKTEELNKVIILGGIAIEKPFYCLIANRIPNIAFTGFGSACQCFPFYIYKTDGTGRKENITDWALKQFREYYVDEKITKLDIFYYIYGMLHHPGYRDTFKDCLKRDLPRIPFAPKVIEATPPYSPPSVEGGEMSGFWAFSKAGRELAEWQLNYEKVEPYDLEWIETPGKPLSYRIEKMKLTKDKTTLIVNDTLTLNGIPPKVFEYRLGNRSALEWVIDQYRVKTDKRTQIVSDPNSPDDPEYIVRLIGQVIRVSLETVKTVNKLPKEWHI